MRFLFVFGSVLIAMPLCAQTATTTTTSTTTTTAPAGLLGVPMTIPPGILSRPYFASLTADEKVELQNSYAKAMTDNPDLQTEALSVMGKGMMAQSQDASDEDRQAARAAAKSFIDKLRTAMTKADPAVEPIIAKVQAAAKSSLGQMPQ